MLLLNGCSYGAAWGTSLPVLAKKLNIENYFNLSLPGSSNDRIFTSTIEYILTRPVDFAIISTTFWNRQSAPWNPKIESYNRHWVSYSPVGIKNLRYANLNDQYIKYIEDRYKFDVNHKYMDMFFHDVICLSGFLTSRNIRHVIYSAPGDEFLMSSSLKNHISEPKLKCIQENKSLINLDTWSSNLFLHEAGSTSTDVGVSPSCKHYQGNENLPLVEYLYNYIQQNNI
jgi:hypothetical protein